MCSRIRWISSSCCPAAPANASCAARRSVCPDPSPALRAARFLSNRINTQVNNEDKWLCSRVQRGLASGSYKPGPLSNIEGWMFEFHNLLRERIPEFAAAAGAEAIRLSAPSSPRLIQADLVCV